MTVHNQSSNGSSFGVIVSGWDTTSGNGNGFGTLLGPGEGTDFDRPLDSRGYLVVLLSWSLDPKPMYIYWTTGGIDVYIDIDRETAMDANKTPLPLVATFPKSSQLNSGEDKSWRLDVKGSELVESAIFEVINLTPNPIFVSISGWDSNSDGNTDSVPIGNYRSSQWERNPNDCGFILAVANNFEGGNLCRFWLLAKDLSAPGRADVTIRPGGENNYVATYDEDGQSLPHIL